LIVIFGLIYLARNNKTWYYNHVVKQKELNKMKKSFLVEDNSGSLETKTLNEKELIAYANDAHWVEKDTTKPIDPDWQVYACNDVRGAIEILKTDNFRVTEL
jgi:hypothetical protein